MNNNRIMTITAGTLLDANLNDATATIDSAGAAAGKLFGRLQANQPQEHT